MAKLKLGPLLDDKPIRVTMDVPAEVHRDLIAYAEALGKETGKPVADPSRLIPAMIERFMASDRAFTRASRKTHSS